MKKKRAMRIASILRSKYRSKREKRERNKPIEQYFFFNFIIIFSFSISFIRKVEEKRRAEKENRRIKLENKKIRKKIQKEMNEKKMNDY